MLKSTLKWALLLGSLLAVGPLVATLMMRVNDVDGGRAVTFLVNGDLTAALMTLAVLVGCVLTVGVVAARLFGLSTAMACAGFIVAWTASAQGNLESIVRRAVGGEDLPKLAVEGLLVTLAAGVAAALFGRISAAAHASAVKPSSDRSRGPLSLLVTGDTARENPVPILLASLAAGVIVSAIGVWLIALSGARNQTLAAAILGGIAAGAVNQVLSANRSFTLTPLVPILSIALLGLLAPLVVLGVEGQGANLVARIYDGTVLNLARPVSLDWAAGALIGVPLGMSWAGSAAKPTN